MRKRITSLLLTLVMLLSLVPAMGVTASAADGFVEVSTYEELRSEVDKGGAKVKLVANIDTTNENGGAGVTDQTVLTFTGDDNILDLNGHTLKLVSNTGATFFWVLKDLTIKDSGTGGRIDFKYGSSVLHRTTAIRVADTSNSNLTVESGTLSSTNNGITLIKSEGNLTINGGKFYAPHRENSSDTFAIHTIHQYHDNAKTIITDGEIDGVVFIQRDDSAATGTPNYGDIPVQIKGGTFKEEVQLRWTEEGSPSGHPTEFSPAVEIAGGIFEKAISPADRIIWGQRLSTKLTGGTFKDYNSLGLGKGGSSNYEYYSKSLGNSIIMRGNEIRTSCGWSDADWFKVSVDGISLDGSESNPVTVIPNAWGMKSVTLDGTEINYAKDWKGTVERMDNSTAHTLKFEWYPLAQELKDAGYTYRANFDCYTVGSNIPTTSVPISATATEYSHTIPAGVAPSVYPFDLQLNLDKNGSSVGIMSNQHIVKLVVSEAPPAPPAPVAHSITITNTFGTANPTTAIAGETITVKANDRTADNMMFTQWYTETAGVTFANATQRETTFTMPDCDVRVSPGYHGVSFTKQPVPQISLEKGYGGKTSFAFSWDISKWELVDTATNQTVSSGDTPVKAGKLTDVTIPANTDLGSKTYRIVVTTANEEQFKSNDFIVTWFERMPAPLVEFNIPSGTKFIGELTVNVGCPSTLEAGGASPFETCYTTNGVDPKDAAPSDIQRYYGYTDVTLTKTTHFMARTILEGEGGNEDTWGELCEATYTMIDKLDAPTVTPESCSYSGSLPIIVTIQDVYNAKIDYSVKQHDGYLSGGDEPGPMLETGLPDTFCGTTTFSAKAIVYKDGGGAWESNEVTYTYTREYWANISNATISGKVHEAIAATDVTITLDGEKFKDVAVGDDVSGWFNLPAGLTAKVKEQTSYSRELVITISGTPSATSAAAITVTIPKDKLLANGTVDLTVLSNPKAVYNIGTDAAHTHDYTGQPYLYLDPGNHYQECTENDGGFNIEAHDFNAWTPNSDDATHSRTCSKCKKSGETANYTETANHNWQWVVDTAATPNAAGKQHEECVDCHAKRSENTEIPMLTSIMVEHLTVAKPVKDAAAAMATTTDSSYTVANTEWMAADGTPLAIGGKFQPGTVYTVKITLKTAGAGVFSVKSTYNTIEGKTATVSPALTGDNHADSVILTYTFDATEGTYVPTKPAITTVALPDGKVGDAYNQTLAATGTNPIAWSIETGNLPDGLTLVGDTIKGTPSKAGDFKFTVKATNGGGSDTKELTIKVADAEAAKYHNVTLSGAGTGATGAGSHAAGTTVNIYAGTKSGYTFNGWTSDDVTVLSASSKNASFVMPDKDVTVKANWVYNGGGSSGGGYTYYTIKATAGVNGSISPTGNVSVREGRDQTFTITPNKGYAVAKVLIDSKNVGAVKSYTFENVKKNHTIEVVFMKASGNPQTGVFVDVPEGSYYEEAVNWAVEKGITTGTDATHFSPDGICTRAQAVTFLWRAAGSPAAKSAVMPFTDVKAGSYYYDAVLWAVENGITKGTSDTMFSPDATCSRAQIVTFLWRSQKSPAAGTANPFTDVKASAYYADAVLWAVKEDVTKGTTNTTFSPDANCTRAQIVTFIWRALAEYHSIL